MELWDTKENHLADISSTVPSEKGNFGVLPEPRWAGTSLKIPSI